MRKEKKLYDLKELGKAVSAWAGDGGKSGDGTSCEETSGWKKGAADRVENGHGRKGSPSAGRNGKMNNVRQEEVGDSHELQGRMLRTGQRVVLMDSDVTGIAARKGMQRRERKPRT